MNEVVVNKALLWVAQKNAPLLGKGICEDHDMKHADCPCLVPHNLHCLPKDDQKRRSWLKEINRKDVNPSAKSVVSY